MSELADSRFVFLAHTAPAALAENYFAVLCLLHAAGHDLRVRVTIYTDDPAFFADLPVAVVTLDEELRSRASGGYRNKLKSVVMLHAASRSPGALIFCDGDTWLRRHPAGLTAKISASTSVLHLPEVRMDRTSDPNKVRLRGVLERSEIWTDDDEQHPVSPTSWMWNSGVVGVHSANFALLRRAAWIGDQIHAVDPSLVSVEQFSLTQALLTSTRLKAASRDVFHYWAKELRPPFITTVVADVERLRGLDLRQRAASAYAMRPRYTGRRLMRMRAKNLLWAAGVTTGRVRSSV